MNDIKNGRPDKTTKVYWSNSFLKISLKAGCCLPEVQK